LRLVASCILILIVISFAGALSTVRTPAAKSPSNDPSYVLVGGQNGTWFSSDQDPRLDKIDLGNYSKNSLSPVSGDGTVWSGGWNGSQWLISGWGTDQGLNGSDPYIFLYNGQKQVIGGSLSLYPAETTWLGGDVFAASSGGRYWLLCGLGSGNLTAYGTGNHMSLAIFDGSTFTDLSPRVPHQNDEILYANAWNGQYWLVGGGYGGDGILFTYDGRNIVDLTQRIGEAVPGFASVQAIAWNGLYWLIGGDGFLAAYDGHEFTDLTSGLDSILGPDIACCSSVNAIAWNGFQWMLGGGAPVAQVGYSRAWLVNYADNRFTDLTSNLSNSNSYSGGSSILSIGAIGSSWIIGGYFGSQGWLFVDNNGAFTNLSRLVSDFTYVDWIGTTALNNASSTPYYHGYHGPTQPQTATVVWAKDRLVSAASPY